MTIKALNNVHLPLPHVGRGICALLFAFATCSGADAQTFLDDLRTDKEGQGKVSVTQTKEIDELVNGKAQEKEKTSPAPNTAQQTTGNTETPAVKDNQQAQTTTPPASDKPATPPATPTKPSTSTSDTDLDETVIDTRKKVMRNSYKTTGYRIQVYSGGNSRLDRQKAETAGVVMKSNFPTEPIYVHFYSPSWKCRMGNYRSIDEARRLLAKVKKLGYPQANIIKGTISVQY